MVIEIAYTALLADTVPLALSPRPKVPELRRRAGAALHGTSRSLFTCRIPLFSLFATWIAINYQKEKTLVFSQSVWHHYTVPFADTALIADTVPIVYTVPSQIRYRLFTRYPRRHGTDCLHGTNRRHGIDCLHGTLADTALIAYTVLTADIAPIAFFELRRFLVSLVLQRLLGLAVRRYLICCWTTNYNLLFPFFPSLFFLCTPKITHIFFVIFFCCDFTQITRLFCPLSVVEICYDSYIFANELVFRD
jgi:hypothetical protein